MQCGNCKEVVGEGWVECKEAKLAQLRPQYSLYKEVKGLLVTKNTQVGINEVFGDYVYKAVKCPKCRHDIGRRVVTFDGSLAAFNGLWLIDPGCLEPVYQPRGAVG